MKIHRSLRTFALAALAAGLTLATPAAAQDRPGGRGRQANPEQRIERRVDALDEKLELSDAQEAQIRGILETNAAEMRERREAARTGLRAQLQEVDSAISAVLTPEQRQAYTTLKTDRREQFKQRRDGHEGRQRGRGMRQGGARGGGDRGARLFEQLDLTDAQETQLRQLRADHREQTRAWMDAHPDATREEKQAYLKTRREGADAAVEAILTPAQVEQYRRLKSEHRDRSEQRRDRRKQDDDR